MQIEEERTMDQGWHWGAAHTARGVFAVAATCEGVVSVSFPGDGRVGLSADGSLEAENHASRASREIELYFKGELREFASPVDLSWASPFLREVYRALRSVPYGETISYGELALLAGHPGAARAVGLAMARNRTPLIIPCHRVTGAGGKLGGWSGAPGWKERLLVHEGRLGDVSFD